MGGQEREVRLFLSIQGFADSDYHSISGPQLVFINKVLVACSHAPSFKHGLWLLAHATWQSCVVVTQALRPAKPKISISRLSMENLFVNPCLR